MDERGGVILGHLCNLPCKYRSILGRGCKYVPPCACDEYQCDKLHQERDRVRALETANAELKDRAEAAEAKVKAEKDTWMHQQDRHMEEMEQVVRERDEARAERDAAVGKLAGVRDATRVLLENYRQVHYSGLGFRDATVRETDLDALRNILAADVEVVRVTVNDGGRLLRDGTCIGRVDLLMGYCDDGDTLLLVRCKP